MLLMQAAFMPACEGLPASTVVIRYTTHFGEPALDPGTNLELKSTWKSARPSRANWVDQ